MICDKITADINCNTVVNNESFDPRYIYIYILLLNKYDGSTLSQTFVRDDPEQNIVFTIGLDGFYTLCRLKITKDSDLVNYFYNEGKFYKNTAVGAEEILLLDLLEVNPKMENSGFEKTYYYYFLICKLRKCFVEAASKVLNQASSIRCDSKVNSFDTYKRDLLWSAVNVISYLAEMELFEEAERLLEKIMSCNGLCENESKSCGCGCGR